MYMNFHMLIYYNTTLNPEKETPGECVCESILNIKAKTAKAPSTDSGHHLIWQSRSYSLLTGRNGWRKSTKSSCLGNNDFHSKI